MATFETPRIAYRKELAKQLSKKRKKLHTLETYTHLWSLTGKPDKPKFGGNFIETIGLSFGLFAVCVIVMALLHCIIWVLKLMFDISWDTWEWTKFTFKWGLDIWEAIVILTILCYFFCLIRYHICDRLETKQKRQEYLIKKDEEQMLASLVDDIKKIVEIPLTPNLSILKDQEEADRLLAQFYGLKELMKTGKDQELRASRIENLIAIRLYIFYLCSIQAEANKTYPLFRKQLDIVRFNGKWNVLREDLKDESINSYLKNLDRYDSQLRYNKMEGILDEFYNIQNRSTKTFFFFTSTDKLARKTEDMMQSLSAAKREYKELQSINNDLNYLLEYVRVCAFRNIYLGAELLNIIRDNAGGKTLTTEKDMVTINAKIDTINVHTSDIRTDYSDALDDFSDNLLNNASYMANSVDKMLQGLDSDDIVNLIGKNPKMAAGAALGAAAIAAGAAAIESVVDMLQERSAKIEKNNEVQKIIVENVKKISDSYIRGQGSLLRAIEIIKAITKANKGFMQIYEPLKKQVFEDGDINSVKREDLLLLAKATNDYNKISKAKL